MSEAGLVARAAREVTGGAVFALLPEATQERVRALTPEEVTAGCARTYARPMPGETSQAARLLLNPALAVQWLELFEELGLPRALHVFEPCAGGSEPVVFAAEIYSGGTGDYTTVNLNRRLAGELREKTARVRMKTRIIEDEAQHALQHLAPESIDVACFHHAINDLLQTAVSEPRGMDTRAVEWWSNERQMIEWLAEEAREPGLDARARPAFLAAVAQAAELVQPGGWLLFDHWTWYGHREQEWFPWELFCDLVPLARRWVRESDLPLEEVPLGTRDPQWWMGLRRK
jgi:hypothetical protein